MAHSDYHIDRVDVTYFSDRVARRDGVVVRPGWVVRDASGRRVAGPFDRRRDARAFVSRALGPRSL
jgi:hypothetical protein